MSTSELTHIDNSISNELKSLDQIICQMQFKHICEFAIQNAEHEIDWPLLAYSGVYMFEINCSEKRKTFNEWSIDFLERWQHSDYLKNSTPNSRKKRLQAHLYKPLNDWVPIYLGRAKHIGGRVKDHVWLKLRKPTSALKLMARKNMYSEKFRISTIKVEVENYNIIMPRVEQLLRDRINPILGRQ